MKSKLNGFMVLDSLIGMSILVLVVILVSVSTREFNELEERAYYQLLDAQKLLNKSEKSVQTLSVDEIFKEGIELTAYDGKKVHLFILEK